MKSHKRITMQSLKTIVWFNQSRMTDASRVGGKSASLGEMISQLSQSGVQMPGGFATTAGCLS